MDDGGTAEQERPSRPRRMLAATRHGVGAATRAIGLAVTILALNFALGWGWDAAWGSAGRGPAPGGADGIHFGTTDPTHAEGSRPPLDRRATIPQMRAYPWSKDYFRDLAIAPVEYWPSLGIENEDFRSRYVNQRGGSRVSYEPATGSRSVPTIAFYGGSTMWGEGQRDGHTIASEVARLAEGDGMPVHVDNRGIRGVASWDEALLFESDVASADHADLAVFYDGWNDCELQQVTPVPGQPWEYLVDDIRGRLGVDSRHKLVPTRTALDDLWAQYARHSLVHKLAGGVGDLFAGAPAGAAVRASAADAAAAAGPAQVGRNCARVYKRARAVAMGAAKRSGVDARFFWQPRRDRDAPAMPYRTADPLIDAPTIDISHVLDHVEGRVYIDGGHTNELGARLVAEAIYARLKPAIAARYAAGG